MPRIFFDVIIILLLISCDGSVGENGIVQDSDTGERIPGVSITMDSFYKRIETISDSNGYFATEHFYSCGIKKCDETFNITFEKEGYDKLEIDETYRSSAKYVNQAKKDTLIIEIYKSETITSQ
jgi:hypothetical protein